MFLVISVSSNISGFVDDIMAGSSVTRQSKTILARSQKELQLEAAAREEAMSPEQKARQYARDMKIYEGAKRAAARRGLNS